MFTGEEAKELIALARDSINSVLENKNFEISPDIKKKYSEKQGCFVTLKKDGKLRGCIGMPEPVMELYNAVSDSAKCAAFKDSRFSPLTMEELGLITIEISLLTLPELISIDDPEEYFDRIRIGKHGLMLKAGPYSGLLLPQVPVENGWDVEDFLRQLCMKAYVSMDAWKNPQYQIFTFEAQVFMEEYPEGKVVELCLD